jgi:hypothetical protein
MTLTNAFWLAILLYCASLSSLLRAQALSGCVEELALPGYAGYLKTPAVFDIYLTVGPDGKATGEQFSTADTVTIAYLRAYFVTESTYSRACQGQRLHFVVTYTARGVATDEPRYETRWRSPNQILVTYNPLKPKIN